VDDVLLAELATDLSGQVDDHIRWAAEELLGLLHVGPDNAGPIQIARVARLAVLVAISHDRLPAVRLKLGVEMLADEPAPAKQESLRRCHASLTR
jgi:hypothetical protein